MFKVSVVEAVFDYHPSILDANCNLNVSELGDVGSATYNS